jgi:hypothetical protein
VYLGHAPIVEKLPTAHRVAKVGAPVVCLVNIGHRRRDPTFGHDGVRFPQQ